MICGEPAPGDTVRTIGSGAGAPSAADAERQEHGRGAPITTTCTGRRAGHRRSARPRAPQDCAALPGKRIEHLLGARPILVLAGQGMKPREDTPPTCRCLRVWARPARSSGEPGRPWQPRDLIVAAGGIEVVRHRAVRPIRLLAAGTRGGGVLEQGQRSRGHLRVVVGKCQLQPPAARQLCASRSPLTIFRQTKANAASARSSHAGR